MGDALKKRNEYETVKERVDRFHILDSFFRLNSVSPVKTKFFLELNLTSALIPLLGHDWEL